jgi:FixJ family two-component response regulator
MRTRFEGLSAGERQVVALLTSGWMNKQIACEIGVSEVTVKMHRRNLLEKLGIRSLASLVRIADVLNVPHKGLRAAASSRTRLLTQPEK